MRLLPPKRRQKCVFLIVLLFTPLQVKIGAYVNQIAALNVPESHVRFDFYLWIKWPICLVDGKGNHFRFELSIASLISKTGSFVAIRKRNSTGRHH